MLTALKTFMALTFIIAVAALILGWVAFNRTTTYSLEDRIGDRAGQAVQETGEGIEQVGQDLQ